MSDNVQKETLISLENLERFKANLENLFGKADGIATLDVNGKIPEGQITEEAFNVFEYANRQAFPVTGHIRKLYIDKSTNIIYRWDETSSEYISTSSPDVEAVQYVEQELTEAQKAQARSNIGAVSADEIPPGNNVQYVAQVLTTEQKAQARTNIGAASADDVGADAVKYTSQVLTSEQKAQARQNISAADSAAISSINSQITSIEGDIRVLQDNVSDVSKVESGLQVDYANGTNKTIELDTEFPIDSMEYDSNHLLHLLDKNGEDLVTAVLIEGGGGGGGGGGSIKIQRITNESVDCVYGVPLSISFSVDARDGSDDPVAPKGSAWTVNGVVVARNIPVNNGTNSFNISPYLSPGINNIKLSVTADVGALEDITVTKTWRINAVNMRFEWNYNDAQINTTGFTDMWVVYGDVEKTSHTVVDNVELPTTTTSKTGATQTLPIPMQTHGTHSIERWLSATIGQTSQVTPVQYHEMIFAEQGNIRPIISVSIRNIEMNQYDTIKIPIVVYNPSSVLANATLYVDGVQIGAWENIDRSIQYWYYTPNDLGHDIIYDGETPVSGTHTLSVQCGETTREIPVIVHAVNIDIEEVSGYTFKFKSSDFASNTAVQNWESNGINATFSNNFNWVNGGLQTETDENGNLQQYLCIKAGTRMTINHRLFASDPKARGMTFKIIYKTKNCRNYDAEIMHSYSGVGIRMYAHSAIFNSTGQTITVPYGEEEYSELEFDVYPVSGYRYMMAWMDGVITSCRVYDSNDSFTHPLESQDNIVIGSDDCDVYIYLVKAYPMLVERSGHIDNFIMDAPNAAEMAKRYNRNDILEEGGNINYTQLAEKNPNCRVWLYEISYFPNSKSDKVGDDDPSKRAYFNQIWNNGDTYYQLSGRGIMSIQGTSSENYRLGAANTDINFTELEDGNGNNLLAGGTKDKSYGGSNNWYTEDKDNPGHAKEYTVLDVKIIAGIRQKYTPQEAMSIARVSNISELGSEWVVYEEDDQQNPTSFINTNDQDGEGKIGPEFIVVERDANRNPVKYIRALGIKLNDDSTPITYSNTKVNFASCEQVNNMCNAAWYQRFNPYPSLTQRDCMEFNMGVQFIKDHGEIPDASHWILWNDDKYHMYSIANMGNSKKNVHVFHDLSNPNEICVEVNDNNDNQMRMVNPDNLSYQDYFAAENWDGKHYYGMRYPDTKNPSTEMKDAWYRLVWWMANSNPSAATGEPLAQPETYADYTFRGHDREGLQVLRGTTITQYSGTYTHDTFERRMAKMLSECEDYMVMDSFIYHYLYLERHTMVDNVSKNNFWSSTDLIHWDLSKAYDMDTSDGNNNQGQMKFDYGNEWDDYIGDMRVFNGGDSVWFVFCANLYEACRTMFVNRESAGAWSAVAYHNFLLEQQRKVPERCWVECYWYDYLRTYEQGISDEWMTFLDGGQKSHQRNHYEYFEELYDSSKYRGSTSTSSNINFRAYTPNVWQLYVSNENGAPLRSSQSDTGTILTTVSPGTLIDIARSTNENWGANDWRMVTVNNRTGYVKRSDLGGIEPTGEVTITMYNKMYVSVDAGTKAIEPIKAERGVPITIPFNVGYINNMLVVINTAPMIQAISGLEKLYPDTCNFAGAVRLRQLAIGSNETGYQNTFLETLSVGNNTMLEYLYAQNLPNANSVLDMSNCPSLLYLDASNSAFTAYTFADGGLLETAIINRPTSLSLVNLAHLEDAYLSIADLSGLISLRYENTPNVDAYSIVNNANALQIVRLIGIHWIMSNDNTLMRLLGLQGMNESNITIPQSVVAGYAYTPSVRQRSLDLYNETWHTDLTIDYDNIVTEFIVRFFNPDSTPILNRLGAPYIQYVDRGQTIIDPVANDLIDTPEMEPTAQYTYTFSGWSNITGAVMDNRDVIATYETTLRTYTVRWFSTTGVLLKTVQAPYGSEVVYQDNTHTFPPTKTDEEQNLYFWVFKNWDKSTGNIVEDTDVYAVWDRAPLPSVGAKQLKDMSIAEIYGIAKTNRASEYFENEDSIEIQVGKDFEFSNVPSQVLLEERYFNGNEVVRFNDIKLFDPDAPSFTLAVDYEFAEGTTNAAMISCCDSTGLIEGFKVHYYVSSDINENQSIQVLWGNTSSIVGHGLNRGMIVLRHKKGSRNLLVASNNGGKRVYHYASYGGDIFPNNAGGYRYDGYNENMISIELPRAQDTITDAVLSFGAIAYGSEGYRDAATGWVHWAKIWFGDLGTENVRELAEWPHEIWKMQYRGHGLYNKDDGTGLPDSASFIANAPLPQFLDMYPSSQYDTTGGWRQSVIRSFINSRCLKALPYCWQSIIKPVSIPTKGGSDRPNILEYTTDKIYIPAYADMTNVTANLISSEGKQISWFTNNYSRIKFMGINIPDDAEMYTDPSDPTLYVDTHHVKEGDVWVNDACGYVYISQENAEKHGFLGGRETENTYNNIPAQGSQGGMWVRSITYWTRTNTPNYTYYQYTVYPSGAPTSTYVYSRDYRQRGVVIAFSI